MAEAPGFEGFDAGTLRDIANLLWQHDFDPTAIPDDLVATLTSEKNSPTAHGDRMRRFLEHLLEGHPSHTVDHSDLYRALLDHVDALSPLQLYVMRNLLDKNANEGYTPIPDEVVLEFPRDHALILDCQTGWHFFVGSCWDTAGQEYGVEIMFFGDAIFPPALAEAYGLTPIENQAIEMQFAVSRRGGDHKQAAPIVALGTSGLVQATDDPFSFRLGRNAMVAHEPGRFLPITLQMWGLDESSDPPVELAIDISFGSGKEYLAQGDHGAMPAVAGMGSKYYSIPEIQLDPTRRSTLRLGDEEVELARASFWFDHQWGYITGNSSSAVMRAAENVGEANPVGWDWFMAQFDGDRQITCLAPHVKELADEFYDRSGDEPPGTMRVRVGGTYMDADRQTRVVWGDLEVTEWVRADASPSPVRYPPTGVWNPDGFHFTFDEGVPDDIREFHMVPIVADAQSAFFANGAQICEGAVVLTDRHGRDVGRGFAESVQYANTLRNMLHLAGLPDDDRWFDLVAPKAPPLLTRTWNTLYVLTHRKALGEVFEHARGLEFFMETGGTASSERPAVNGAEEHRPPAP